MLIALFVSFMDALGSGCIMQALWNKRPNKVGSMQ